ncbi:hypothetical protein KHQ81_05820 [Mycoplasmatota bacterium]|nr:hypothetical protein KHQ81_05820 [Mycoplasmatota bacterium]
MAKKTNKKPGQASSSVNKNSALTMKRRDNNLNHSKFTKFIIILMILAFVGVPVAGLVAWLVRLI